MSFLNNIWLWSGLAALGIALPVIIHLLNRLHRKTTDWAAIELLRRAMIIRSRRMKMEDLLVLILRCLTLMLLALAMARPTLREGGGFFGSRRVGVVVGLDASMSMRHGTFSPRFDDAIRRTSAILSTVAPGDPVSLVLMGARPRVLLNRGGYNPVEITRLLKEKAEPLPEKLNPEANLEELERLVAEMKTPVRECYLVTDAQAASWETLSDSARAILDRIRKQANLYLVPLKIEDEENMAITRLDYTSGALRKGGVSRFTAEVRNYGLRPQEGASALLEVNGQAVTRRALSALAPGAAQTVSFLATLEQTGSLRVRVQLSPDGLETDNVRCMALNVPAMVRVLAVDGSPDESAARTETFFLRHALNPRVKDAADSPLRVQAVHWQDLADQSIEEYDIVVLANVPDIAPEVNARLFEFVRAGGGLMVFPGAKVPAAAYNTGMRSGDVALLPAQLGTVRAFPAEGETRWVLKRAESRHPLAMLLQSLPAEMSDDVRFETLMTLTPEPRAFTVFSAEAGRDVLPLLVEKQLGAGRVLLFAASANRAWSDFPTHPLYPMLMQQAVNLMVAARGATDAETGAESALPVSGVDAGVELWLRDPKGREDTVAVVENAAGRTAVLTADLPGFYELALSRGGDTVRTLAVNVPAAAEGDVRTMGRATLDRYEQELGLRILPPERDMLTAIKEHRIGRELWRSLLALALLAFGLQAGLSAYFTRRQRARELDVADVVAQADILAARKV